MSSDSYTLEDARGALEGSTPAVLATCSPDGMPNTTILSKVYPVDAQHVALSFQFFSKTIRNVRANPKACILVKDPVPNVHWTLHVEYVRSETEGALFERMDMEIEAIASATGMSGIFKLKAADVYKVLVIEKVTVDPL